MGKHNILNSVAAISVCLNLGVKTQIIKRALKKFDKQYKKLAKRAGMSSQKKAKMAMKKKPKMAMKKAKASQTAGAIMKRERMMN